MLGDNYREMVAAYLANLAERANETFDCSVCAIILSYVGHDV